MKLAIASAMALTLLAGTAQAQSSAPASTNNSSSASSSAQMASSQKIKNDLQSAGFKDISVTPESFFVQAKTKDGDPVMMTIGPHGMSMIESVGAKSSSSNANSQGSSSQTSK